MRTRVRELSESEANALLRTSATPAPDPGKCVTYVRGTHDGADIERDVDGRFWLVNWYRTF